MRYLNSRKVSLSMDFEGNSSSLKPMKRPKEYYDDNDLFIVRLPSNLRGSGEQEFHIGKDILNRSDKYSDWGGNEVLSRMQKKYCFSPMNMKSSPFSCEAMVPNFSPRSGTPKKLESRKSEMDNSLFRIEEIPSSTPPTLRNSTSSQCNWSTPQMGPMNNWQASQIASTNNWIPHMTPVNNWTTPQMSPTNIWTTPPITLSNWTSQMVQTNNWTAPQMASTNNWTVSQVTPMNNWSVPQVTPTSNWTAHVIPINNWSNKQCINSVGINNSLYCKDDNISGLEKSIGTYSEKSKLSDTKSNGYFARSEIRNNETLTESMDHHLSYNQKEDGKSKSKHLNSPEKEIQKIQGSKLLTSFPVFQSEKLLVSELKNKNAKCIIFTDLNCHRRFLHNLPQPLPTDVHLIAFFDRRYKFPVLVSASLEQLIKTNCFHIHPDSNKRKALSQEYIVNTINRSHAELALCVTFILLTDENPIIDGVINNLLPSGRRYIVFPPHFEFSEFYSVFKNFH